VVSTLIGALTIVPVPGRPMTYFTQSATGSLQADVLPVPIDNQCPAGTVVR
jgi:hypothetical protein